MMTFTGSVRVFNPSKQDWMQHVDWLDNFLTTNGINKIGRMRAVILMMIGSKIQAWCGQRGQGTRLVMSL